MGEFSVKLNCRSVIRLSRVFFGVKVPKVDVAIANADSGTPSSVSRVNTLVSGCALFAKRLIRIVLSLRTPSKIKPAVVESEMVFMVGKFSGIAPRYKVVHVDHLDRVLGSDLPEGVKAVSLLVVLGSPIPLHEPIVIGSINDGVLTFGKGDKSDRLILRLNDFVSDNTGFLHGLTSNKIVRRSAAFAL